VAALDAACWGARDWLGADGLSEGASADVVVCRQDPRRMPSTVAALQNVVLRGVLVR
jgi:imidazolonepropionase-like amidohydrolase